MNIYKIEQYETHIKTIRIEANSAKEAIEKLWSDDQFITVLDMEFVEVNTDIGFNITANGISKEDYEELLPISEEEIIPGIRSITKVS